MFSEAVNKLIANAGAKAAASRDIPRYLTLSALAGLYIGLAIFLIYSIGAPLSAADWPLTKLLMGASFSIGLSLVAFGGAELFSGNILFIGAAALKREIAWRDALRVLLLSWAGNILGTLFLAFILLASGLFSGQTRDFIIEASRVKAELPPLPLLTRGVMCNLCVCLALWTGVRLKEELAKLALIAMCVFAFIASGYEHCVANMFLLALSVIGGGGEVSPLGYFYNVALVSIGNIIGGMLVAAPYVYVSAEKRR
ncbi:MAG: formate/nitrite transporter family protein [Clostridiales bacterium]|jgi:nitrite transporter NirC|nr:formate/nitrite transporter family protein [Clostridiales bacterium]